VSTEAGDQGEASRKEYTRLEARAIRERWPMSAEVRVKVLKRLCKIVDDDAWDEDDWNKPGNREVISAARALISADKLNLEQAKFEHATQPPETPDGDYDLDLSQENDPAQQADRPPA